MTSLGEPWIWLAAGALALGLSMVFALLLVVGWNGSKALWPSPVVQAEMVDGRVYLGELRRGDEFTPGADEYGRLGDRADEVRGRLVRTEGTSERRLLRVARPGVTGENFNVWLSDFDLAANAELPGDRVARWEEGLGRPEWAIVVERLAGGRQYGILRGLSIAGEVVETVPERVWPRLREEIRTVRELRERSDRKERDGVGPIYDRLEEYRLMRRRAEMRHGEKSAEARAADAALVAYQDASADDLAELAKEVREIEAEGRDAALILEGADGREVSMPLWGIVRAFPPNRMNLGGKLRIYGDRFWELLTGNPRNGIQEGGLFPAIFGTVFMTLIMSIVVLPFGVLAALYLREYARQGVLVSTVRIAVNNLAGVPSIVFGVFGLGFFCYGLGKGIDQLFYAERLPNPTFGKGGLIWASLTLALLTLPVVIVATEEALSAVPGSMREGSYACGASKWQTIRRIVLPRALPGILTGMILAVARGAGEVAPLMVVGAVALAPELPFSLEFPEFGLNRSFMHLGFQIYELGFKSPDAEAAVPFVYTTTLLLIGIVVLLNLLALRVRASLRRRYLGS